MKQEKDRVAFFAGSFNPFTIGHADIVRRTLQICDRVVIALGRNPSKQSHDAGALAAQIRRLYEGEPRVSVIIYEGLTAEAARESGATFMIRGVRNSTDFEFERALAETNLRVFGMETLLLPALPELAYVSSSMVRELESFNKDVSQFLPGKQTPAGPECADGKI